ncbi:MAG: hypothetical protein Ct9H90mP11_05770 [Acidimicrobiales bacterium]|nr:MAG: hypothetical protein Ct9H90mP11_05770 [Acidimicrobiales bacterium]
MVDAVTLGADGVVRCAWPGDDELYVQYHDQEWGYPEGNDMKLFEKICLEGFQARFGLDNYSSQTRTFSRSFF